MAAGQSAWWWKTPAEDGCAVRITWGVDGRIINAVSA